MSTYHISILTGHGSDVTCLCALITDHRFKFTSHSLYVIGHKSYYIGNKSKSTGTNLKG